MYVHICIYIYTYIITVPLTSNVLGIWVMHIFLSGTCITIVYNYEKWETNLILWDLRRDLIGHVRATFNFRNTKELETTLEIVNVPVLGILYTTPFNFFLSTHSFKSFTLNNCSQMPLILP